ncbi:MAG: universal stress protein [Maricaulis sp.]|jgi:nucleotide-binding universal stress UspA family protein|uniref:universal stress protein n=1 Tax=Maricaulis sp. TaxID=1486257 RepID=UPI001B1D8172|nr:universal stress protein [Maricaulis sp.]MBO6728827.1 universal stress protein [Maricaulis sp.]MBO6846180.1 universal stress protein [Maricaulis sp.]MBO6875943.1 universal stress protein [Maricaulis sp.]MDM7984978.1 universal stress protein [Maricaulis sp.]
MPNRTRKFLVVADESPEARTALYFAARRAVKTGAKVTVLAAYEPSDFNHWIGVAETAKRESEAAAETLLESMAEDVEAVTGERPELLLREGERSQVLSELLCEDPEISLLILGASRSSEGPGPLVSALARGKGLFSERNVPVTVVPGDMPCEEIDALT